MADVVEHYQSNGLTERIVAALESGGIARDEIDGAVLGTVDEFHLGGGRASERIVDVLRSSDPASLLDVGCGIGGFARRVADELACPVTGIDLTPAFVETAIELTALVGQSDSLQFREGSATSLDSADESFDAATLLHVGMNIADKAAVAREFARVVRPGGTAIVYDVMRMSEGEIPFPVPWSAAANTSFVERPDHYVTVFEEVGFTVEQPIDLTDLVLETLASAAGGPPPPVNLAHLMGNEFPSMISNLVGLLRAGVVAPTLLVATRE